jgi:hypothetical protein
MSEITNQPLYLIKFDDTEVSDETMFGAETANKRFEQISGNWNAHLFVKVASNSRDDTCSGSNARLASDYDALAAQRDEGLAREAECWELLSAYQQRLAEAEKLLRKVDMRPAGNIAEVPIYWWNHRNEFLQSCIASPGCADGEKSE